MSNELHDIIDVYNPGNIVPVVFSFVLFLLYMIIAFMETSITTKETGLGAEVISRLKFILTYTFGHFIFFLKLVSYLITLYLLLTIIRIIIIIIFNVFTPMKSSGGSYSAIAGEFKLDLGEVVKKAMINNGLWVMGFYAVKNFTLMMVAIAPMFILFNAIVSGIFFYNPDKIQGSDDKDRKYILDTVHHEMFITEVITVIVIALYLIYLYYIEVNKML